MKTIFLYFNYLLKTSVTQHLQKKITEEHYNTTYIKYCYLALTR